MTNDALKDALRDVRRLLRRPVRLREPVWPTLLAAAFFAFSALTFAAAAILAPPVTSAPAMHVLRGAD